MIRFSILLALVPLLVACEDDVVMDDWGVAGYARLVGSVSAADGSPLPGLRVYLGCGRAEPTEFGNGPAVTDARGAYRLDATVPFLGYPFVDSGAVLVCRASASAPAGGMAADSTIRVRFIPRREELSTTILHLRARAIP